MPQKPVPMTTEFWNNMREWAGYLSTYIAKQPRGSDARLAAVYYDGQACAQRVRDNFADASLDAYVAQCHEAYVTDYLIANAGRIQGFRTFTNGQLRDIQGKSPRYHQSLLSVYLLLSNQNYHVNDATITDVAYSREVAYAIMTFVNVKRARVFQLTPVQEARLLTLLNAALGHVKAWKANTAPYFRPFMGALTAYALYYYHTFVRKDSALVTAAKDICDISVNRCWKASALSFTYTDRTGFDPDDASLTPDLNMLIVPTFGWVFNQLGLSSYRTQGDDIWRGGVSVYDQWGYWSKGANLGTRNATNPSGKHYNQQLFWGPEYITLAQADPIVPVK
jgi:hypothetical protein